MLQLAYKEIDREDFHELAVISRLKVLSLKATNTHVIIIFLLYTFKE